MHVANPFSQWNLRLAGSNKTISTWQHVSCHMKLSIFTFMLELHEDEGKVLPYCEALSSSETCNLSSLRRPLSAFAFRLLVLERKCTNITTILPFVEHHCLLYILTLAYLFFTAYNGSAFSQSTSYQNLRSAISSLSLQAQLAWYQCENGYTLCVNTFWILDLSMMVLTRIKPF